ncbi:TrmB family transcriptional regulator [Candidatus Shapirobacteria bacterium]|nr:TrmB family transcriptional regulator [Candidatus Shapirobacteria bacterium]
MRDIISEMIQLGFSQKEAQGYLSCLELGTACPQKIGERSGMNRATTYAVLKGLMKKGLVTPIVIEDRQSYRAEPPSAILTLSR